MRYIKVNIITEASGPLYPFFKGSGLVTAYKELVDVLLSLGIDVKINSKEKCDLIHIHSPGPLSAYWANKSKIPVIITAHTLPHELRYLYRFGCIVEKIARYQLVNFYNRADVIIAPTSFTRSMLEDLKINKPIEVISNGINIQKFQFIQEKRAEFRKKYEIQPHEKVIYSVGLMAFRKGFDKFMAIARKMEDYKFVWSGRKASRLLYRHFFDMKRINLPNVIKTGYITDITAAHCAGDVFLFPSPFETQGIVALEAAACSRPMIVEDIPSFEWLGKSCLMATTVDEYCIQIEKALKQDENILKNAKMLVKDNDIIKTGKSIVKVYEHVLSGDNVMS